jgi:hypothetical protein
METMSGERQRLNDKDVRIAPSRNREKRNSLIKRFRSCSAVSSFGAGWIFLDEKSNWRLWLQNTITAELLVCLHDPRMKGARQWISVGRMATRGNFPPLQKERLDWES